jgi:ornithine carbamoyltransferase
MRHCISLVDMTIPDIHEILDDALALKSMSLERQSKLLKGTNIVTFFQKRSTRTDLSMDLAGSALGAHVKTMYGETSQIDKTSPCVEIDSMLAMLGSHDIFALRTFDASLVQYATSRNGAHVIDLCSNKYHPCQAFADILTMKELSGGLERIGTVAWIGPENNVCNSLKILCAKLGIRLLVSAPYIDSMSRDEELDSRVYRSGHVARVNDHTQVAQQANWLFTDTFVNMEHYGKDGTVLPAFKDIIERGKSHRISREWMNENGITARVLHCLPAHFGVEITPDVYRDHKESILRSVSNRVHVQKAIMLWLLRKGVQRERQRYYYVEF